MREDVNDITTKMMTSSESKKQTIKLDVLVHKYADSHLASAISDLLRFMDDQMVVVKGEHIQTLQQQVRLIHADDFASYLRANYRGDVDVYRYNGASRRIEISSVPHEYYVA